MPASQSKHQAFYVPAAILLGSLAIAASVLVTGGLGSKANPSAANPSESASVSVDDDFFLGDPGAPVTIVEFSDFQCPYCRSFWSDTLPQIKSEYIDTGKVKFVYRDFPLGFHEMAQKYAEGAQCAGDQGKYWEMHDKIFEKQALKGGGTITGITVEEVKSWAGELGLDRGGFDSCLDSGKYADEVKKDFADGSAAGVSGTPSFFVGKTDSSGTFQGQMIEGAQPFAPFKAIIDELLAD